MNQHPSIEEISAVLSGRASDDRTERFLQHIDRCPTCLETIDSLWSETMNALKYPLAPEIEEQREQRIQQRLLKHIRTLETKRGVLTFIIMIPLVFLKGMLMPYQPKR